MPQVESLEHRRFFSAQPVDGASLAAVISGTGTATYQLSSAPKKSGSGKATVEVHKVNSPNATTTDPVTRSTDLVGEWDGKLKVRFGPFSKKFDYELSITDQSDTFIRGRVEVDGHDYTGTFYGKINPKNGRFRYKLDEGHDEIEIRGQLSKRGKIIGGGKVDAQYDGWDFNGTFEIDRIA